MKLIVSLAVILGLSAGGYWVWKSAPAGATEDRNNSRPTAAVAEPRDIQFAIGAAGDIGPADQVSVRPEINGRIVELPVDIGDKVKKGDLLCTLDDQDLQTEKASQVTQIEG